MKVFTSIFVLEDLRTKLDDLEMSVRFEQEDAEALDFGDGIRCRVVELQARIDRSFDRPESDRA